MKTIPLTQGKVSLIDDEDHPALPQPKWMVAVASACDYAQRHGSGVTRICTHHEILRPYHKERIIFLDGPGLNLQRSNLTGGRTPFPNGADRDSRLIRLTREHSRLSMLLMANGISPRCYVTNSRSQYFPRHLRYQRGRARIRQAITKLFGDLATLNFARK